MRCLFHFASIVPFIIFLRTNHCSDCCCECGGRLLPFITTTTTIFRRNSRTKRRVYHTLDLDIANDEIDEENDAAEDDWLVKRAKKEGLTL